MFRMALEVFLCGLLSDMFKAVQMNGKGTGSRECFVGVASQLRLAHVRGGMTEGNNSVELQSRPKAQSEGVQESGVILDPVGKPLGEHVLPAEDSLPINHRAGSTSKGPRVDSSRALFL